MMTIEDKLTRNLLSIIVMGQDITEIYKFGLTLGQFIDHVAMMQDQGLVSLAENGYGLTDKGKEKLKEFGGAKAYHAQTINPLFKNRIQRIELAEMYIPKVIPEV